jgi:ubiquinone biosynthesis accessory factor UbiK
MRLAARFMRVEGAAMLKTKTLDGLAHRIGEAIGNSPAKDVEKNVKALLQSGLQRLDLVPREEFEVQAQVLARTREKLEALEARVTELEAQRASPARTKGK